MISNNIATHRENTNERNSRKPAFDYDLQCMFASVPKSYKDPRVDTHILVVGFHRKHAKMTICEKGIYVSKTTV